MNRATMIATVIGMTRPDTDGAATLTPSTAESTEMAGVIMLSPKNSEAPKIPSAARIAFARRPPGRARRRIKAISAMIPPSPSLSARITSRTYVTVTMIVTDQKISEMIPKMLSCDTLTGCGSPGLKTVCTVYSGLVPMSPKTTPRAPTARAPCAAPRRLALTVSAPLPPACTRYLNERSSTGTVHNDRPCAWQGGRSPCRLHAFCILPHTHELLLPLAAGDPFGSVRGQAESSQQELGDRPRDDRGRLLAGPVKGQIQAGAGAALRDPPAQAERVRSRGQRPRDVSQDRVHPDRAVRPVAPGPSGDTKPQRRDADVSRHTHRDAYRQVLAGAASVAGHMAILAGRGGPPIDRWDECPPRGEGWAPSRGGAAGGGRAPPRRQSHQDGGEANDGPPEPAHIARTRGEGHRLRAPVRIGGSLLDLLDRG